MSNYAFHAARDTRCHDCKAPIRKGEECIARTFRRMSKGQPAGGHFTVVQQLVCKPCSGVFAKS